MYILRSVLVTLGCSLYPGFIIERFNCNTQHTDSEECINIRSSFNWQLNNYVYTYVRTQTLHKKTDETIEDELTDSYSHSKLFEQHECFQACCIER